MFIPRLEEGDLMLSYGLKPGTSQARTIETGTTIEQMLIEFPEVENIYTKIGTAEIPTDPMPPESGRYAHRIETES